MRPCNFISSGNQASARKDMIRTGDGYTLGPRTREGGPTRKDLCPLGSPGGRGHCGDRESQRRWGHRAGRESSSHPLSKDIKMFKTLGHQPLQQGWTEPPMRDEWWHQHSGENGFFKPSRDPQNTASQPFPSHAHLWAGPAPRGSG